VPESDRESLSRDVRDYEPHESLFGGPDGLDVIRPLLPAASGALRRGGTLIVEIGHGQADRVKALLADAGLEWVDTRPYLAGIPRVMVARRPLV
jgi:release factor glutamine methyltransferase